MQYTAGDRVRVTQNSSGHEHRTGSILTLETTHGEKAWRVRGSTHWIIEDDFTHEQITKVILERELARHAVSIKTLKDKLDYMDKIKTDHFDAREYECYEVIQALDDKISVAEKAKRIASIFIE